MTMPEVRLGYDLSTPMPTYETLTEDGDLLKLGSLAGFEPSGTCKCRRSEEM